MKQNDWIVENIEYDLTPSEFKSIGLTTADTQLLPMETYLKSSYITDNPLFKNEDGTFSKDKFQNFYNKAALGFQQFSQDFDTFQYDLFDTARNMNSQVRNPNMQLYQVSNPTKQKTGIAARNEVTSGTLTNKELAQQNKIYDPSTGKYLDYSVNDMALFKNPIRWFENIFSDPIIYATYDDDGSHFDPIIGKYVDHKKGDFKINENGEYYTEKLNGRNIRGKEVVSSFDYITSEESAINKYDFFDSDGFDKSVAGSLFSAAASIAPLFVPYVGTVYSGVLIGRELMKALPMLSGMIDSLLGTDNENNSLLNSFAAKGQQLTGSTSEHGTQDAFSIEGVSKLIADVATQWGQQKVIAEGISKLTGSQRIIQEAMGKAVTQYRNKALQYGMMSKSEEELTRLIGTSSLNNLDEMIASGKWVESAIGRAAKEAYVPAAEKAIKGLNRLGADMSLGYMAIVSNTDVYESLLEHGASKGEAALFALGSTLGMFGVDRTGLGEVFFDELADQTGKYIPRNLNQLMEKWAKDFNGEKVVSKGLARNIINKGKEFGDKYIKSWMDDLKHHTTGFLGKAVGEGTEETAEELVTDLFKQLYEICGQFGITSQEDVGAWDNALLRYGQSFFGGALGGAVFYGVGVAKGQYPLQQGPQDVLFHIRNGKAADYYKKIDEWEKQGKFGSTELSYTPTEVKQEDGSVTQVYTTTKDPKQTQNHFIAERVRDAVREAEGIIIGNELDLTDDELFENLVQREQRFLDMKDWLKDESYATNYYQAYQSLVSAIADVDSQLVKAGDTIDGLPNGKVLENKDQWLRDNRETEAGRLREDNLQKLRDKKASLMKQKEDFLSGENAYYYARKMIFALDPVLSANFFPRTFRDWVKQNKNGVEIETLNDSDRNAYRQEYETWVKNNLKADLTETFNQFLETEKKLTPVIEGLVGEDDDYLDYYDKVNELFASPDILGYLESFWNETNRGANESEEDFNRYTQLINSGVTSEEDIAFLEERANKINTYNEEIRKKAQDKISSILNSTDKKLDPLTYRTIKHNLGLLIKDVVKFRNAKTLSEYFKPKWDKSKRGPNEYPFELQRYLELIAKDSLTPEEEEIIKAREQQVANYNATISTLNTIPEDIRDNIVNILLNEDGIDPEQQLNQIQTILNEAIDKIKKKASNNIYETVNILSSIKDHLDRSDEIVKNDYLFIPPDGGLEDINIGEIKKTIALLLVRDNISEANKQKFNELLEIIGETNEDWSIGDIIALKQQEALSNNNLSDIDNLLDAANTIVEQVNSQLNSDPDYKFLKQIEDKAQEENPFFNFINGITKALGIDNLESELQFIDKRLDTTEAQQDFVLTDEQLQKFKILRDVIELAKGYLYAASQTESIINPYGHNHTINSLAKSNVKLPEITEGTFQLFLIEMDKYRYEIDVLEELHRNNIVNKERKFIVTKEKFNKIQSQILDSIIRHLRFTMDDGREINLGEGIENIGFTDNIPLRNKLIMEVIHNNFQEAVKTYSVKSILQKSKIIESLIDDKVIDQQVGRLDDNITYDSFGNYNKIVFVLNILSLNQREWNEFLLNEIQESNNVVPLTAQQYNAQIAAGVLNSEIYGQAVEYIEEQKLLELGNKSTMSKSVFLNGVAGAGKSVVCAKDAVRFITNKYKLKNNQVVITGTNNTVRQNLLKNIGFGEIQEDDSSKVGDSGILKRYITAEAYEEIISAFKNKKSCKYFTRIEIPSNEDCIKLNKDAIKDVLTDRPEVIVVDEATHFSSIELQLFDFIAKRGAIFIGDSSQDGDNNAGRNLDFELNFLAARTPKLAISLRDNNLQNQENQVVFASLLEQIQGLTSKDPAYAVKVTRFISMLRNFAFRGFTENNICGTVITDKVTKDLIDKIEDKKASIAYVGEETTPTFIALNNAGFTSISKFKNVKDIQGQEFDYVIVDSDFAAQEIKESKETTEPVEVLWNLYKASKKLYTLISRAKVGSIIVKNDSVLGSTRLEKTTSLARPIIKSIQKFKDLEIPEIKAYLDTKLEITSKPEEGTKTGGEKPTVEGVEEKEKTEEFGGVTLNDGPKNTSDDEDVGETVNLSLMGSEQDFQLPIFTGVTVLGAESSVVTKNGHEYQVWKAPAIGAPKRDMEIFMGADLHIDLGTEEYYRRRTAYENLLRQLISGIIHKTPWVNVSGQLGSYLTKEQYEGLQGNVFITNVGSVDKFRDKRVNYLPDPSGVEITTPIRVVAKFGDLTVTIGLPLSEEAALNGKKKLKNTLSKRIERINNIQGKVTSASGKKALDLERERIIKKLAELDPSTDKYIDYINSLREGEEVRLKFKPNYVSTYDLRDGMKLRDIRRNPNVVVSKPYIYIGDRYWIDPAMRGRPVVFVSSDLSKKPEDLRQEYEKSIEEGKVPDIRMLSLSSVGAHINDLTYSKHGLIFGRQATEDPLPIAWGEFGMKVFGSLWNFRANLMQFNEHYKAFLNANGLDESTIKPLLNEIQRARSGGTLSPEAQDLKNKIDAFNKGLSSKVRQFRLGTRLDDFGNPAAFIGSIPKDDFYGDNAFGIYIHPNQVSLYLKLLDDYFQALESLVKIKGADQKEWLGYDINEFRSKIKVEKGKYVLDGKEFTGDKAAFAAFGLATVRMYSRIFLDSSDYDTSRGTTTTSQYEGQIGLFEKKDPATGAITYTYTFDIGQILTTLYLNSPVGGRAVGFRQLLMLALHGTTEQDPRKFKTTEKCSDAYFKRGILIHPKKSLDKKADRSDNFIICELDDDLFYLDKYPNSPTIYAELDTEVKDPEGEGPETDDETKKQDTLNKIKSILSPNVYDELIDIIDDFIDQASDIEDVDSIMSNLHEYVKKKLSKSEITKDSLISYNGQIYNLSEYMAATYPECPRVGTSDSNSIMFTDEAQTKGYKVIKDDSGEITIEVISSIEDSNSNFQKYRNFIVSLIPKLDPIFTQNLDASAINTKEDLVNIIESLKNNLSNIRDRDKRELLKNTRANLVSEINTLLGTSHTKFKDAITEFTDVINNKC